MKSRANLIFKIFVALNFIYLFGSRPISDALAENNLVKKESLVENVYLNKNQELNDYVLDTGDLLFIDFYPAVELSGTFEINEFGEIYLPRIYSTYVRGLNTQDLAKLLEKKYEEFLLDPVFNVRILGFRPVKILISGEVQSPGIYEFNQNLPESILKPLFNKEEEKANEEKESFEKSKYSFQKFATVSNAIRAAGGITPYSDLSKLEIIRDVSAGEGGGKKKAKLDFSSYLNNLNSENDIRLFSGDQIFIPTLTKSDNKIISKSIINGLSPKFIKVGVFGMVENPGEINLPLEATLSDAIDLAGPKKRLSGKIVLIRYKNDGKLSKRIIKYKSNSLRGSKNNPFIKSGDLITVRDSKFRKTTGIITDLTAPLTGVYTTKQLFGF